MDDTIPYFDDGAAHISPREYRAYIARLRGVDVEEVRVPPVVVATFQRRVYQHLRERTAAVVDPANPLGPDLEMVARGCFGGRDLLVARFVIGAPAAAIWMEELIPCGARQFLFVGTAGSLQPSLPIGALALATSAVREEGTSFHYLPPEAIPRATPSLVAALQGAARARGHELLSGPVWTIDAVYRELTSKVTRYAAQGILGVEMEAAALFAVAQFRDVEAALIVAMSDELFHPWIPGFHADELRAGLAEAAEIALAAVALL